MSIIQTYGHKLFIREPQLNDEQSFLNTMLRSARLHAPWIKSPSTSDEFKEYIHKYQQPNNKSYVAINELDHIVGVFNLSEIVRGFFQNAYLGFYACYDYAGKGFMSAALKLVLDKVFQELQLHRVEANIQPNNTKSIKFINNNGFREEGYSPHYLKINNIWCDHVRLAITYEDWMNGSKK